MQAIDQAVLDFLVANRVEWLSLLMMTVTYSGGYMLVGGLTLLSTIFFYAHKHSNKIIPLLVAVGGSALTVFVLKNIFYRARPITEAIYLETGSSFPSGHATMAMALYGFLLFSAWRHDKHHLKNPLMILLAVLITLVGASRLYIGVHYLSDVVAGFAIGLVWILVGTYFGARFNKLVKRFYKF